MAAPLHDGLHPGTIVAAATPTRNQLYATPEDLEQLYGLQVTEGQVRAAQTLLNATCCRPSLWPEEYEERLSVPSDRQQVLLAATPVLQLLHAAGRYSYGRRDRRSLNQVNYDYLAAIAVFGSPPRFTDIDVSTIEFFGATGEVWLPTGFFLIGYTEVQLRYLAGFPTIPDSAKLLLAEILNAMCSRGVSDRTSYQVGRVTSKYASDSFITPTARMLAEPLTIKSLF